MKSIFRFALLLLLPAASLTAYVTGNKGYERIPSDLTDFTLTGTNSKEITHEASDIARSHTYEHKESLLRRIERTRAECDSSLAADEN